MTDFKKEMKQHQSDAAEAARRCKDLTEQREKLTSRVARITAENQQEEAAARAAEREAAEDYTAAVALGDEERERRLLDVVTELSSKVRALVSRAGSLAPAIATLQEQIDALDLQIARATEDSQRAERKAWEAARNYWRERFEAESRTLLQVAGMIRVAEEELGLGGSFLQGMKIPVLRVVAPGGDGATHVTYLGMGEVNVAARATDKTKILAA